MKTFFLILLFISFVPACGQPLDQTTDTLWIQPFLASFRIAMDNAEQVNFVILDSIYASEIYDLPDGVNIVHSISEIDRYVNEGQIVYYIFLSSFKIDSYTAQIEWRNMSAGCRDNPYYVDYQAHVVCQFVYHYDGTSWSQGPSSVQYVNNSRHHIREH